MSCGPQRAIHYVIHRDWHVKGNQINHKSQPYQSVRNTSMKLCVSIFLWKYFAFTVRITICTGWKIFLLCCLELSHQAVVVSIYSCWVTLCCGLSSSFSDIFNSSCSEGICGIFSWAVEYCTLQQLNALRYRFGHLFFCEAWYLEHLPFSCGFMLCLFQYRLAGRALQWPGRDINYLHLVSFLNKIYNKGTLLQKAWRGWNIIQKERVYNKGVPPVNKRKLESTECGYGSCYSLWFKLLGCGLLHASFKWN